MILLRLSLLAHCLLLLGCAAIMTADFAQPPLHDDEYIGELNPVDLLGSLEVDTAAPLPTLVPGERLLLVQSGAEEPHPALRDAFGERFDVVVTSGLPFGIAWKGRMWLNLPQDGTYEYGRSLQSAARSVGADKVLIVFERPTMRSRHTVGVLIGWLPILDWFVPMYRTRAGVRGTLLLIDASTGRSAPTPTEDLLDVAHALSTVASLGSDLRELADEVRAIAYPAWAEAALEAFAP